MAATRKSFLLRLPPDLYADLERWAAQELRSVNAQIEYVLREQVRRRKGRERDDGASDGASDARTDASAGTTSGNEPG